MKQRAIEIIFKRKFLILLPLVIIVPLTVAIALRPKAKQWQVFSVVWVDQYKDLYQDERLGNTPGPTQAQILNSLIHTRTFANTVLAQTSLAPQLATPAGELETISRFWRSVVALPNDNSFITVIITMPNPDQAYEVMQSLLSNYSAFLQDRSEAQSRVALSFYGDARTKAESAVAKSRRDLADYLAAHPELIARGVDGSSPVTARDPNYARLLLQVSNDEANFTTLQHRYDDLASAAAAGREGQPFAFSVIDQPERPIAPVPQRKLQLLTLPVAGLVLAAIISATIAVTLILTNRAILGTYDVQFMLSVPILAEIPELRRRRWLWQRTSRHAVRQRLAEPAYPAA